MSTPIRSAVALALLLLTGCAVEVAHWEAAVPMGSAPRGTVAWRGRHEGRSCRWWIVAVPVGLPQIDEAMAAALTAGGGRVLRDVTVSSDHTFYGLVGQNCSTVRGDVFG